MATVKVSNAHKSYGQHEVLRQINFEIEDGEFIVLVGPSGCGKSTLLRMIAGLEDISSGTIEIGGRVVNDLAPKDRDISMVFQNYALYPHMTVFENMAFSLKLRGGAKRDIARRVMEAARILGLENLLMRYPKELSGGQRQRVAMGRSIVRDPEVFLFDEPLSNLDAKLRVQMRSEIKELHQRLGSTIVYVTHDQVEAMTMADRIVVMRDGRIEQIGTPMELYNQPTNTFVGGFIGSPAMNFLNGYATEGGFELEQGGRLETGFDRHGKGICGVRPESWILNENGIEALVNVVEPTGADTIILATTGDQKITGVFRGIHDVRPGSTIKLSIDPSEVHYFTEAGQRILSK